MPEAVNPAKSEAHALPSYYVYTYVHTHPYTSAYVSVQKK